jgi:hypothetical protein
LPKLIADQAPLTQSEIARGTRVIHEHFSGDPHEFEMAAPTLGVGHVCEFEHLLARGWKSLRVGLRMAWVMIKGPTRPRREEPPPSAED